MVSSADCRSAVFDCGGSIPSLPTISEGFNRAHIAQLAEHFLGKEEVIGSSPIVGSIIAAADGTMIPRWRAALAENPEATRPRRHSSNSLE